MYWVYRLIYIGRSTGGLNTRESILEIYLYYVIKEGDPNYKQKEQEVWAAANKQVTSENNGKNLRQTP